MRVAVLLAAAALCCPGETFEWWQTTETPLLNRGRLTSVVHTQFRMRQHFSDLFQGRIGPVARFAGGPRWTLIAGYYLSESEGRSEWRNNHRTFAGIECPVRSESRTLTLRSLFEHHFGGGNPYDRRFRELAVISFRVPLSPYAGTETFFDRYGFMMQRFQAGIRHQMTAGYMIDIGYLYDARRFRAGDDRHVIQTIIRPRRRPS